jgi:hypothetical protein
MTFLNLNQLIKFVEDGHVERVLWLDAEGPGYVCIDIHASHANPFYRRHEDITRLIEQGSVLQCAEDPFFLTVNEAQLSTSQRNKRSERFARIVPLLNQQPDVFDLRKRGQMIAQTVLAKGESRHSLLRLLRRYWQRGMTPNAMLPDYANSGASGRERVATGKRRGRPPKNNEFSVNVTSEMRSIFKAAVTKFYGMHPVFELTECYYAMLRTYFSDPVVDPDIGRQEWVLRPDAPSWWQFRYWYRKDNDIFDLKRRRVSSRIYDKDMRALTGTAIGETTGPGSRYLIDATIADVYLVSRYYPDKIVGRPVVYVVIDVFSRMIVGIHVGFEGPSWVGAMQALANAVLDKMDFCTRYGIVDMDAADWPSIGMPEAILGDRGEMVGEMVETLIQNFSVRVENSAPYRADWKGVVEQQFRLLPARFKAYTPGYIQEDYLQRGGTDYRLDAMLNIDQFTRIMIYCVRYYNTQHQLKSYNFDPEMIHDKVPAIPVELWNWGIVHRSGRLRRYPDDMVRLSLLPHGEATVTERGIRLFGLYYSCPLAIREHWFERARQVKSWRVRVSYDPRCMDTIWLQGNIGRARFTPCSLMEQSRDHAEKTLWEIDQLRQASKSISRSNQKKETTGRINLIEQIQGVVSEAKAQQLPPSNISNRQRTRDIRGNRRSEQASLRHQDAIRQESAELMVSANVVQLPGTPPAKDYSSPDITEMLRKFRKEDQEDGGNPHDRSPD